MSELPLTRHGCDEGGILCELYREAGYGQLVLRTLPVGQSAGGHWHRETDEWWLVVRGEAVITRRHPTGKVTQQRVSGDLPQVVNVPAGVWHQIENVGDEEVVLFYWASHIYDPERPDKEMTWNTL